MSLLVKHKDYIEELRKEFYSTDSVREAVKCSLECNKPQVEGLVFAFVYPPKQMHVMDVVNNLRETL